MSEDLLFTRTGAIGHVTFNRPHARNALTFAMYDRLAAICAEVAADNTLRVLVLAGTGGKAFAAGTDPAEFDARPSDVDAARYVSRLEAALGALERCPVPTLAAVAGICTGDGALVAACCDLRIGSASTRFGVPMARTLGACLSARNVVRLADIIGPARVKDLVLTGRLVEAAEALHIGALHEVVPDHSLADRVAALAADLATHAPQTMAAAKAALLGRRAPHAADDAAIGGYLTDTFREGMAAFHAKRKPQWQR